MTDNTSAKRPPCPGLDARLGELSRFVRDNARFCDVGTDHAYLPLALLADARISCALACDINEGPCKRAAEHIRAAGMTVRTVTPQTTASVADGEIAVMRTDGLCGVEGFMPSDICVAGMGGELIIQILSKAPFIRAGVRLLLQPMTRAEGLRQWLCSEGFYIEDEALARADGRIYQIIAAHYDGVKRELTPVSALLGERNIERRAQNFRDFALHNLRVQSARLDGLRSSGRSPEEEKRCALLCSQIEQLIK